MSNSLTNKQIRYAKPLLLGIVVLVLATVGYLAYKFTFTEKPYFHRYYVADRIKCENPRPGGCPLIARVAPPYLCGSDGKEYQHEDCACINEKVKWYIYQVEECSITKCPKGEEWQTCKLGACCCPVGAICD